MAKNKVHSKALRQAIDLELDTMGMAGPITRREVAEKVYRTARPKASVEDERDAWLMYLMSAVGYAMSEPISSAATDRILAHLPPRWHYLFSPMPRFICISPSGGPLAMHRLSLLATADEWGINADLKDHIIQWTAASRDHSRDARRMLLSLHKKCIADI